MGDLISRQDAINVADAIWSVTGDKNVAKVWDQLKDLPSVQPETSILTVTVNPDSEEIERVARKIKDAPVMVLPAAQQEIIRCKDCKWYGRVDKRRFYRGMDCLQKHIDTIVPDRDFCSKAERRGEQDG